TPISPWSRDLVLWGGKGKFIHIKISHTVSICATRTLREQPSAISRQPLHPYPRQA
ncbi:MAG: hypothetical protein F6J98_22785, partial [Moorea sp. SIO4G2]|nr:hypothetical protein [Moorena sp. SIO4G2]